MEMYNRNNRNRAGIYAQTSAEATAAGAGFALQRREKSPVVQFENRNFEDDEYLETEHHLYSKDFLRSHGKKRQNIQATGLISEIEKFPRAEAYYGREKWRKTLQILYETGYLDWEINVMLGALQDFVDSSVPPVQIHNEPSPNNRKRKFQPHIDENPEIPDIEEIDIYPDFRITLGDVNNPALDISPENCFLLENYLDKLVSQRSYNNVGIYRSTYINQTLLVEAKNQQTIDLIKSKIPELNKLWPDANIVFCKRDFGPKRLELFIPNQHLPTNTILTIIKKQNNLPVENWNVINRERLDDGINLLVEVDSITHARLIEDQDDLFFLMSRISVRVPLPGGNKM